MTNQHLLGRLRRHCNDGPRPCPDCDPATGRYCRRVAWVAELWFAERRVEVLRERLRRAG